MENKEVDLDNAKTLAQQQKYVHEILASVSDEHCVSLLSIISDISSVIGGSGNGGSGICDSRTNYGGIGVGMAASTTIICKIKS